MKLHFQELDIKWDNQLARGVNKQAFLQTTAWIVRRVVLFHCDLCILHAHKMTYYNSFIIRRAWKILAK